MKFLVMREVLLTSLQMITGVVEKRQTMPVLANILLDANDNKLLVTGTNMEVELVAELNDIEIEENGRITVPARKFFDICKSLPEGASIKAEVKDARFTVDYGKSHFSLSTLPADHFPNVEEQQRSNKISLLQKDLKHLIECTAFAMAQQDVRYYLNGMLVELNREGIRTVTTDGHRLAMADFALSTGVEEAKQIIVPRKSILELARILSDSEEPCVLTFGDNHLRANVNQYTFTSKLIDGKFPDYQRVVPRGGNKTMVADRLALRDVLARASILSHENIRGVRLHFEPGELRVHANNTDQEEAEDSLEIEYDFESVQIGFNVSYLLEVLNVIEDNFVKLTIANSSSSALLKGIETKNALYVVMPMRL